MARAGSLASLGRTAEAKETVRQVLERVPDLTIESYVYGQSMAGDLGPHLIETMRLAGFPPCAKSPADLRVAKPERLPECIANREKQN